MATRCGDDARTSTSGGLHWEGLYDRFDRWLPHLLLAVSLAISVTGGTGTAGSRPGTVAIAVLAAVWVVVLHTAAPAARREAPWHAALYLAGLLGFAWLLMTRDLTFFIFAITGFLHAILLRPLPLVFVGTGATSFLILTMTWGGFPRPTVAETAWFLVVFVVQTGVIGIGILSGEKLTEVSDQRRRTVEQLEATLAENEGLHAQLLAQAREAGITDERQRMAREIHDTLAQSLTGIITQLEAAQQSRQDTAAVDRHLARAAGLARDGLAEARRSVQAIGPSALERGRLPDALDELARDWSELTGVRAEVSVDGKPAPLPASTEVALLRVAQEALANVAKHAAASRVGITLSFLPGVLNLDVRDDGVGFDPAVVEGSDDRFGLTSMRQRVRDLAGTLAIETEPTAGTAICATVPTDAAEVADVTV